LVFQFWQLPDFGNNGNLHMPALRLKTKLVAAITGLVAVIVTALAGFYIAEVVHQRIQEAYNSADLVQQQIFAVAHGALEADLTSTKIDLSNPAQVAAAIEEVLQTDYELNSLLDAAVGNSPTIYDAAIIDARGLALLHTNPAYFGKPAPQREDFLSVVHGGIRKQLRTIYGPAQVYDVRFPLIRDDKPFGEVRVGISTVFLKAEVQERMRSALLLSGGAIFICMLVAAALSNLALHPLEAISRRLDLITAGHAETTELPSRRSDEYGAVSTKIERLGQQMRNVQEVFSALKENLDQMMANLQDGVMLFTSDLRAVLVSASAEQFLGKPRSAMLGCTPAEIFSEDSALGRAILGAIQTHQPVGLEEIETEQGRRIQISLDFIEEHGERIGALLTLRDAESVHRIEDEIELSRRLAAIGRLTSGVAHEVKNPINAIVVHLEVLRQKLHAADPDTRRHMDVIGKEIHRLDRVVQTLVDFTRPVELRLVETDLRRLVDEVVTLASPEAEQHQVRIERQAGPDPLPARVDADLVKQALLNIVLNGVQAMPGGGSLHLACQREGENALISAADQGSGIPAELQDKVFNLYFTTKKGGSGIGLAMAYRVVQLHHGSVEFTSVAGEGTTFYLRFPLSESMSGGAPVRAAIERSVSRS
jgi:signal transduction histidine kinase